VVEGEGRKKGFQVADEPKKGWRKGGEKRK